MIGTTTLRRLALGITIGTALSGAVVLVPGTAQALEPVPTCTSERTAVRDAQAAVGEASSKLGQAKQDVADARAAYESDPSEANQALLDQALEARASAREAFSGAKADRTSAYALLDACTAGRLGVTIADLRGTPVGGPFNAYLITGDVTLKRTGSTRVFLKSTLTAQGSSDEQPVASQVVSGRGTVADFPLFLCGNPPIVITTAVLRVYTVAKDPATGQDVPGRLIGQPIVTQNPCQQAIQL